ncbi:MAG TPA: SgcJ/EcaC family oxidoreductase [Vicinamibacterales bacterium]|nr:SgcJ/EcaC family oxidoreductase [Vicinamibacterales bacterium]
MPQQFKSLLIGALAVLAVGFLQQPAWAQAEAAIRRLPVDEWCKAEAARDLEGKMRLFTADAVLLPPGSQPVVGEQAIRVWHEAAWKQNKYECSGIVDEVQVLGEWGFARGTFSGVLTPASGGAPIRDSGKFINIVRRQADGSWRLARVIWNTN